MAIEQPVECRNGCGKWLTFSPQIRQGKQKWIPIEVDGGNVHNCPKRPADPVPFNTPFGRLTTKEAPAYNPASTVSAKDREELQTLKFDPATEPISALLQMVAKLARRMRDAEEAIDQLREGE